MANKIEYPNIRPQRFVTPTSRYRNSKVLYYSDEKIITFETYKKQKYQGSGTDQVTVIPISMQYRPDLLSQKKYGTVDFWWKIMEVNGIKEIMNFKAGRTILLPGDPYV
jgi:hypothetical protein